MTITLVSCMSPHHDALYEGLADHLSTALGLDVRWSNEGTWQDRLGMVLRGDASLAAICGLQYALETSDDPLIEPLIAPVPNGARYGGRPVYFSEVLVAAGSPYKGFDDLSGARWAYNEPTSHSGFGITAYELARRKLTFSYFGEVFESGDHIRSLKMLLSGRVDAITIDSTVLDLETDRSRKLRDAVRSVASLGPSPAPPVVVNAGVPGDVRDLLREGLLSVASDGDGEVAPAMQEARVQRFATVNEASYDEIRRMAQVAAAAGQPGAITHR